MINFLLSLIILALVFGLLYWCVSLLPIPEPFMKVIQVAFICILIVLIIGFAFGGVSMPFHFTRL